MQVPTVQAIDPNAGVVIMSGRPANMMNLIDSVITCLQKYVGFEGRASRSEYWWFFLATTIASFFASIIDSLLFGIELTDPTPISWALTFLVFLPSLAVGIRRIHDHGMSGWFCMVPFYNFFFFFTEGESVPNIYGHVPTNIQEGKSGVQDVIVQEPMSQMSDDGYWKFVDGEWVSTELQDQAIAQGANPHISNTDVITIPQTSEQIVIYSSPSSGGANKTLIVISTVIGVLILTVILAGVLYVWASSLAQEQESSLVGDWTNPVDKLELQSNGDAKDSTGTFESWYTSGENIYFEDEDYFYKFRYSVVGDILFLNPYDEDGDLSEEECIGYLEGNSGESESYFNDRIEQAQSDGKIPNWCNF